jgi:NADPH:quinone reductase-like Zn-dependent oxidoreductase
MPAGASSRDPPNSRFITSSTVKAILPPNTGAPDLLRVTEVDKPAPKDNEVLIAIHATTVSTADCNMCNFTFVTRPMLPLVAWR